MIIRYILWLCIPLMVLMAFAGLGVAIYLMFRGWILNAVVSINISVLSMCLVLCLRNYLVISEV